MAQEPIRFGVLTVGRCAWEALPGMRCGRDSVAVDLELHRSLCAEHALATIGQRQEADLRAAQMTARSEGEAAVEEAQRIARAYQRRAQE